MSGVQWLDRRSGQMFFPVLFVAKFQGYKSKKVTGFVPDRTNMRCYLSIIYPSHYFSPFLWHLQKGELLTVIRLGFGLCLYFMNLKDHQQMQVISAIYICPYTVESPGDFYNLHLSSYSRKPRSFLKFTDVSSQPYQARSIQAFYKCVTAFSNTKLWFFKFQKCHRIQ